MYDARFSFEDDRVQSYFGLREVVTGYRFLLNNQSTKELDPTRPCIDASGNYHVITDIYDVHDYTQDIQQFKEHFIGELQDNGEFWDEHDHRQRYQKGLPFCVSDYGGIKWDPSDTGESWEYGNEPRSDSEFIERYRGLTEVLLSHPKMFRFCYTQWYDVA